MKFSSFYFAAALLAASPVVAQNDLTVFGSWDCEIMGFTLDAEEYNISGKVIPVATIEKIAEDGFGVALADEYRFALFDVLPDSLTWHSPASGDTFECRRE